MGIIAGFMVPHPPMIVPEIGRGSEAQIEETTRAYERVADEIAALCPETIVITSPHSVMYADWFHISPGGRASGSFAAFRAPGVKFSEEYDTELVEEICRLAKAQDFPAGTEGEKDKSLDHGTMVPLWFIRNKYKGGKIVRIGLSGLPFANHYKLGMLIKEAAENLSRRVVFVASGDLSHKLQEYGPYGFVPEGPEYDEKIMDVMGRAAFGELLRFDEKFCDRAAECGHRSFVIMSGAFDGTNVAASRLSHQSVTGVGYGICTLYPAGSPDATSNSASVSNPAGSPDAASNSASVSNPAGSPDAASNSASVSNPAGAPDAASADRRYLESFLTALEKESLVRREKADEYVRLAYEAAEAWITRRETIAVPAGLPADMLIRRAGVFVSIHKQGALRGCIGTIGPVQNSIAEEIIENAKSASTRDPRFAPIRPDEFPYLEITVDVLGDAEDIDSEAELDVTRYGVIVTSGRKRGLLLPDLEGVDTPAQQIDIARQKAGIHRFEKISLQRFEVIRHY